MAVAKILGLVLISLVQVPKAYATICYHYSNMYFYTMYVGYCYQGCCGSQCCESTTKNPELDGGTTTAIIIGCVLGFALFVAIVVVVGVCCYYKLKSKNQIHSGHVLTAPQTYPVMFQGTYSHTPGYQSQLFSHNHAFGVSHAHFQSDLGGQNTRIERTQFSPGQRNDLPGYHPEIEMTQLNQSRPNDLPGYHPELETAELNQRRPNDPPAYQREQQDTAQTNHEEKNDPPEFEALPGPSNGNTSSAPPADVRY